LAKECFLRGSNFICTEERVVGQAHDREARQCENRFHNLFI